MVIMLTRGQTQSIITFFLTFLLISANAFSDRLLERGEILGLFNDLAASPANTWIPCGTIEADHVTRKYAEPIDPQALENEIRQRINRYIGSADKIERTESLQKMALDAIPFNTRYELQNEYTMTARETITYYKERFCNKIETLSRQDSIQPDLSLSGNYMTNQFSMLANQIRISAWNGIESVFYSLPINHAIVKPALSEPPAVDGIINAGLIPWGYGVYTAQGLANMQSSAIEKNTPDGIRIKLTLSVTDQIEMVFTLDPERDYIMLSRSQSFASGTKKYFTYTDYQQIDGHWVPFSILIEKYSASGTLLLEDNWTVTSVSTQIPELQEFTVNYLQDAKVEYQTPKSPKMQLFIQTPGIDGKDLLARRLDILDIAHENRNCATAALGYVTDKLGQTVSATELTSLIDPQTGMTSLFAMKSFLEGRGLFTRVVNADLPALETGGYDNIILHFPGQNHFVVAEKIMPDDVKIVDLNKDKFLYAISQDVIHMDWPDGIAMIVSSEPISLNESLIELTDQQMQSVIGGDGYACTNMVQQQDVIFCEPPLEGECTGFYYEYFERYACATAPSGSCYLSIFDRYRKTPCLNDPNDPSACKVASNWTTYYMYACQ